jgi:hypothetical protein
MPDAPKLKPYRRWSVLGTSHRTELQLLVGVLILSAVYSILYPASFPTMSNVVEMSRVGGILFVVAIA